ncbi:hypothetical protein GYMLUDRAFT_776155 [Collybiopsis luxurians FD-317 M1]|uniref:Uncharacterized protein n=1 Tax=Collybiopsis luxurians FD-317 M1 TaxID=944289 RepID=A0A0D0C3F2_9AGAR|nr:hypothetical protein GYMLUDRAFT_776155 [Collybiopsis luxurians FD-317 M1]
MATTTSSSLGFPCPSTSSLQALVDDTDVARIRYSDGWFTSGTEGLECNGTTHGSAHQAGTQTTATFDFEGVGVQVFGTIGPGGIPTSTYQVDDLPVFTFTFNSNTGTNTNYRVQFYTSPFLEAGNHTLVISSIGEGSSQMFLDYIIYNPVPSASTSTLPSLTSSTASATAAALSSSSTSTSVSAGALAGGIVGGTFLGLVLGILLAYMILRRRQKGSSPRIFDEDQREISRSPAFSTSATAPISLRPTTATAEDLATTSSVPQQIYTHRRKHQAVPSLAITSDSGPTSTSPTTTDPITPLPRRRTFGGDRKQPPSGRVTNPSETTHEGGAEIHSQSGSEDEPPAYASL